MLTFFAKKVFKLLLFAFFVLTFLVLGNLYTYKRFTLEKPIAQLSFAPVDHQVFDASLRLGNFCKESTYRIYGDEWRIDAEFLKWKSWATLFGLDAMYRLDRLSGRYSNIEDENAKLQSAHDLKTESTLDLNKIADRYSNKFPPVDTIYGSSAYEKMQKNILYTVFVTQSGILIREQDISTKSEIDDCASHNAKWKETIVTFDQKLAAMIDSLKVTINDTI